MLLIICLKPNLKAYIPLVGDVAGVLRPPDVAVGCVDDDVPTEDDVDDDASVADDVRVSEGVTAGVDSATTVV